MEARVHEDRGHSGEPKVPNTLFGFILPGSITIFVAFTVFCYVCCKLLLPVHCILCFIGSSQSPVSGIYKWEQTD